MIPLYKSFIAPHIEKGLAEVLYSGQITGGKYSRLFEERISQYIGNPFFLTTNHTTSALIIALKISGFRAGDKMLASPLACLATTSPLRAQGADLRWVDIDPQTMSLDLKDLREKIRMFKPHSILNFHWGGIPSGVEQIRELADENGIKIIEDASEAFGASVGSHKIGATNTHFVCFSFNPVRQLSSLDGGGIAFRSEKDYLLAQKLRDYGIDRKTFRLPNGEISPDSDVPQAGYGFTLNNVNSFVGLQNLAFLDEQIAVRRRIAAAYDRFIDSKKHFSSIQVPSGTSASYWIYTFYSKHRDGLLTFLRERGIYASKVHMRNDIYTCFEPHHGELPGVNYFSQNAISIPCGHWVEEKDVNYILDSLEGFARGN